MTILNYDFTAKNHALNPHKTSGESKFGKFIQFDSTIEFRHFFPRRDFIDSKAVLENSGGEGKLIF